ncbi:hypothetical protein [Mesorhizobium sp. B2-3-15]|uniref:hypothetical protein n=1 Tax=Mesorhizobium sp. B2-3-15 TaxID=2589949 RepID=UPI00112D61C4|nr:hypothetical protein [Mesorhizobium sp. B2-3-15]TPL75963.1 hypothetical protein FJ954_05970 [Mesorhizobium sp. B2-3-15]
MFKVAIVVASLVQPVTLSKQALTICGSAAQSAETTMKLRQMGISLVKVMEAINRTTPDPNKPGEVAAVENQQRQALAAYDHPRYETEDMQQKTIADFRDEEYRVCLEAFTK